MLLRWCAVVNLLVYIGVFITSAKEITFLPLSACLFVCLITKTTNQIFTKFYEMVEHNRLAFEWPWTKVKVTWGQKV